MRNTALENTRPMDPQTVQSNNPLAGIQSPRAAEEVARVLGQIQIAKSFPRDMYAVQQEIGSAFSRMTLASEAVYTFSRGGNVITGPTIRTLEQVASCMQNIVSGYEEVETNAEQHWTKIRCYAFDQERNTRSEATVIVSHKRTGKNQDWLTDPRDIQETIKSQASRNIRSCLQRIIPQDIVESALEVADSTVKKNVQITAKTVENLVEAFKKFGVNREMLEAFIQREVTAITADQYLRLQRIWVSLRDGVAKTEDFFDMSFSDNGKAAKKATEERKKAKTAKKAEKAEPEEQEAPQEPAEEASDEPSAEDIEKMLNNGPSV